MRVHVMAALSLLLTACAAPNQVNSGETTAAGHRAEAQKERDKGREHLQAYTEAHESVGPGGGQYVVRGPFGDDPFFPQTYYDPARPEIDQADWHFAHAEAHERAARELERFEEKECRYFPPQTRSVCPQLGPAVGYQEIKSGVQITFDREVPAGAIAAHMRCHQAYARANGYGLGCPLFLKGLDIRVTADEHGVTITTGDAKDLSELRERAKKQIIVGKPRQ